MIRLLISATTKLFSSADTQSVEDQIRKLESELDSSDDEQKKVVEKKVVQLPPTSCYKKTGSITAIESNHIVIDSKVVVNSSALKDCPFKNNLQHGSIVTYLANEETHEDTGEVIVNVVKLLSYVDDGAWQEFDCEQTLSGKPAPDESSTIYFQQIQREEVGFILHKQRNTVIISTDVEEPITVPLANVKISFVPMVGDSVTMVCLMQVDPNYVNFKGEILKVKEIMPTRLKTSKGYITDIDECGNGEVRAADGAYVFFSDSLPDDYVPHKGDQVCFEAIDNETYTMRCIKLIPVDGNVRLTENENRSVDMAKKTALNQTGQTRSRAARPRNLDGITISGVFQQRFADINERRTMVATIVNGTGCEQTIMKLFFLSAKASSQLQLHNRKNTDQVCIPAGEQVQYEFGIKTKLYGTSKEDVVWCLKGGKKIYQTFEVIVGNEEQTSASLFNQHHMKQEGFAKATRGILARRGASSIVPGRGMTIKPNFIDVRLKDYPVPSAMLDIMLSSSNRHIQSEELEKLVPMLAKRNEPESYPVMYHTLLHLEEIHIMLEFRKFDMERAHFTREDEFLVLSVQNIGDARPSILPGDKVNASTPWSDTKLVYQGIIHKVLKDKLLIQFNERFHNTYNGEDYKLDFDYSRGAYRKQHHAVDCVWQSMGPAYLFPTKITTRPPILDVRINDYGCLESSTTGQCFHWINPNLNPIQKEAVANVLRAEARPAPYVIYGPPGTGKTMTLVELIQQIIRLMPDSRLLVGTPSNSSANLLTERIANSKILEPGKFIRLVSTLQVEREAIPEHLAQFCATVDVSAERSVKSNVIVTRSGLQMKLQLRHLGQHRITISTCVSLGQLMQLNFPPNHFTHIIVDEAGQCLETETLIPMTFINKQCGVVVLAGDPRQIGPIVFQTVSRDYGFSRSLMQRYLEMPMYKPNRAQFPDNNGYNPALVTKLLYNYRALPSILSLYSNLFYDSLLIAQVSEHTSPEAQMLAKLQAIQLVKLNPQPASNIGYIFYGVNGVNKQTYESPSWFNPAEAKTVIELVFKLYSNGISANDIGIITPYTQQVRALVRILTEANVELPKIGTVEDFQGQERSIIFITTVRSSKAILEADGRYSLGFVSHPARINVAISRAKSLLVIIGNPHLLALDKSWVSLLRTAIKSRSYYGCDLPETLCTFGRTTE